MVYTLGKYALLSYRLPAIMTDIYCLLTLANIKSEFVAFSPYEDLQAWMIELS